MSDAQNLLELTATDHALLRLKKRLDDLPQRAKLLELRAKRAEVDVKAQQVAQMQAECSHAIKLLQDEEATLKDKTAGAQVQIDATSNYKEATALAHEIEGFVRRMEKIEYDMLKHFERSDKIAQVAEQVNATLARIAQQDEQLLAAYQKEAGALKAEASASNELRGKLATKLPPDLLKRYEKARESKGGFGAAHIEGNHCSGCRVEFTEGQLAKLKNVEAGEEISECPYCHRLLVVK